MKELSKAKEKKLVAKLLVETKDTRRETYRGLSSSDMIRTYSHLKDPEMVYARLTISLILLPFRVDYCENLILPLRCCLIT